MDGLGDRIAVEGSAAERVKNQQIECALEQCGRRRFCHFESLPMTIYGSG